MKRKLTFDFTNLTDTAVDGNGISDALLDSLRDKAGDIHTSLMERRNEGALPYMDLPYADPKDIVQYAGDAAGRFENFVNVGIGGSALGAQALFTALRHPFHNLLGHPQREGMRMFFADNIDPDLMNGMFEVCDPRKTLYNIITKSGSTAETMGTFLLVRSVLKKVVGNSWADHVVITTDARKGDLRAIAETERLKTFPVPDGVGGRFSALTPVGLLPAACAGIDIAGLLSGAADMDRSLRQIPCMENPACLYAMYQYLLYRERGKVMSVMMPYSSRLFGLADWYRQLWAESLGKRKDLMGNDVFVGPTPIKALGVTDQHSQVQLYIEGPFDKVFTILRVEKFEHDLPMTPAYEDKSSLRYLGGEPWRN